MVAFWQRQGPARCSPGISQVARSPLGIFSGDGRFLAVYDGHGTTTIWNTEHQERIARVFHRPDMAPRALSRDARHIAVAGSGGDLLVLSLWPDDLLSEACTTIGRTQLTPLEWKRHIGHGEPRPTCPE